MRQSFQAGWEFGDAAETACMPAPARVLAVIIATMFALFICGADLFLPLHPMPLLGFNVDGARTVLSVQPGSSADRAGVRVGDSVDKNATPFSSWRHITTGEFSVHDTTTPFPFAIRNRTGVRTVQLVGEIPTRTLADNITNTIENIAIILSMIVAGWLVVVRPSRMTGSLFLFCAFGWPTSLTTLGHIDTTAYIICYSLWAILNALSSLGLAVFALRFPGDRVDGWRRPAQAIVIASAVVLIPANLALFSLFPPMSEGLGTLIESYGSIATELFVIVALVLTYLQAPLSERAKIRWVGLGLTVGLGATLFFYITSSLPGLAFSQPPWLINSVTALTFFVPLSVVYVVIRHHVFDVRFVLGRAAIYGVLTTFVIVVISLVDYTAGKLLSETRIAFLGEAGIAVLLGLSLNRVHKRLETIVEAIFFRERRRAEHRLARVAEGILHASSRGAIAEALVTEPSVALNLTSCALFRAEDDHYIRIAANGWETASAATISRTESAILQLSASPAPLRTHDASWASNLLPTGLARPYCAFGLFVHGRIEGVLFVGPHLGGEALDPDELALLAGLVRSAGLADERLDAEDARARSVALESEVRILRGLVRSTVP